MSFSPDDTPTDQRGGRLFPDPTATTLPIAPRGVYVPPPFQPPPPTSPSPDPFAIGAPPPPRLPSPPRSSQRPSTGAILLGVISAFLLVALGLVGVVVATGHTNLFGSLLGGTAASATATPTVAQVRITATASPVATATDQPTPTDQPTVTAVPTITPTTLPATATPTLVTPTAAATSTPSLDYRTVTANSGLWYINAPTNAMITRGTYTLLNTKVPNTQLSFPQGETLTVYELPQPIPDNQAQAVFNAILAATGATNVVIVEQPHPVMIGTNPWTETVVTATVQGQSIETSVLYAAHGTGGIAISSVAPVAEFDAFNRDEFLKIEGTFVFLS